MKKSGETNYFFWIAFTILVIIIFSFGLHFFKFTGNAVSPITTPADCSQQQIEILWSSIFKESSVGILFNNSFGYEKCVFAALKRSGSEVYFLNYADSPLGFSKTKVISASHGNFTIEYANLLESQFATNYSFIENSINNIKEGGSTLANLTARGISSLEQAEISFNRTYKNLNFPGFKSFSAFNNLNTSYAEFDGNDTSLNISFASNADVVVNYSYETYYFSSVNISNSACTPNWTRQETSCLSNETKIIFYNDTNNCGSGVGRPNTTNIFCDYDMNGIVGDATSLDQDYSLSVYIAGSQLNNSINYSMNVSSQQVQIKKNGTTIIIFNHNFSSSPINFKNLTIKLNGASSSFGYIIINGINEDKSVYFDKKNSSSNQICIKDEVISSISNISADCNDRDEYLINCPGASDGYNCSINNSTFYVTGLEHSAVKEFTSTICLTNWSCSAWSNCTNLVRNRTCTDTSNCSTTVGRPSLSESCTPADIITSTCSPMWTCTDWSPEKCSADENQTRTCTDTKKCNTSSGKPKETQVCENPTNFSFWWLVALIATVFVALLIWLIITLKNKSNQQPSPAYPAQPTYPQSPSPVVPQQTLQSRQFPPQPLQTRQYPAPQPVQQYPQPVQNPNFNNQAQN